MTFMCGAHFGNGATVYRPEVRTTARFLRARFSQIGSKKNVGPILESLFQRWRMKLGHPLDVALLNVTRKHTTFLRRAYFNKYYQTQRMTRCATRTFVTLRYPNFGQIAYSYAMTAKQ
jgi:hypothetical protein